MARQLPNRGANNQAGGFAAGRGLLIVLFAAAIGVLLLARAVDDPNADSPSAAAASDGSVPAKPEDAGKDQPAGTAASTTAAPTVTIAPKNQPQNVLVLVTNGSGVAGKAKANTDELSVNNYNILTPTDHPTAEATTKVYFAPANQADALAVAQILGINVAGVTAMPAAGFPGLELHGAMVLVVLGADNQGIAPS